MNHNINPMSRTWEVAEDTQALCSIFEITLRYVEEFPSIGGFGAILHRIHLEGRFIEASPDSILTARVVTKSAMTIETLQERLPDTWKAVKHQARVVGYVAKVSNKLYREQLERDRQVREVLGEKRERQNDDDLDQDPRVTQDQVAEVEQAPEATKDQVTEVKQEPETQDAVIVDDFTF